MKSSRRILIAGLIVVSVLIAIGLVSIALRDSTADMLKAARSNLAKSRPAAALEVAEKILARDPLLIEASLIAGEAAMQLKEFQLAHSHYSAIQRGRSKDARTAAFARGELLFHLGRLSECEAELRWVLAEDPGYLLAHYRLAIVLGVTGRRWEAVTHQMELVHSGNISVSDLRLLSDPQRAIDQRDFLNTCEAAAPQDPLPKLGLAVVAQAENRLDAAEQLLRRVVAFQADLPEAHARLGELCLLNSPESFDAWNSALPSSAEAHPGIWFARGRRAQLLHDPEGAARCFLEGLRLAPDHTGLNSQMASVLQQLDRTTAAELYLSRFKLLQQLCVVADGLYHNSRDLSGFRKAAVLTERLGRKAEASAWAMQALRLDRRQQWAADLLRRVNSGSASETANTPAEGQPVPLVDVSDFDFPGWLHSSGNPSVSDGSKTGTDSSVFDRGYLSFPNVATDVGVEFQYNNGAESETDGARIVETTGGGIAAVDYDGDLQPDFFFTQGGRWPVDDKRQSRDSLFRNRGNHSFTDVTEAAGIPLSGFGQGVAAGDVNNDGFADYYVARIGQNDLYLNNGDGTFLRSSDVTLPKSEAWTTSCVVADLNHDGTPDLFDVNYCRDDDAFSAICGDEAFGRACSPLAFLAETDRLLSGSGDGRFVDTSRESGVDLINGYGLGVVIADTRGTGRLDVFVANDQVSNFYLVSQQQTGGKCAVFMNEAIQRGLAADWQGRRQGCMGVACTDFDNNGHLDFFVTNFFGESNTLYSQTTTGFFFDQTASAGLRNDGFALLGFGTQFLDADLDGDQDLVVANGHVDDLSRLGQPHRMRPRFYLQGEGQRFEVVTEWDSDSYFSHTYLGRGLARCDWNGDGREEFVVSNIGTNCSVVLNQCDSPFAFISVRLVATASARDGIGTRVVVRSGEDEWKRQLTAGDGFQATNERRLVAGLKHANRPAEITVHWPSGAIETYSGLQANHEYRIVEGRGIRRLPVTSSRSN